MRISYCCFSRGKTSRKKEQQYVDDDWRAQEVWLDMHLHYVLIGLPYLSRIPKVGLRSITGWSGTFPNHSVCVLYVFPAVHACVKPRKLGTNAKLDATETA